MGVLFRTGHSSAVSFSWPVYLFLVLPAQAFWVIVKALVLVWVALAAATVWAARRGYRWWNDRKPPHPEG